MRAILLLLTMSGLASCAMYKSEFDCPAKKGVGCLSVSHVFEAVDDGTLDQHLGEIPSDQKSECKCQACTKQNTTVWFKERKEKGKTHKEHETQI